MSEENDNTDRTDSGYYPKFRVIRNDTGEEVEDRTFTLIPSRDPVARVALRAYAAAAEEMDDNEDLAEDLRQWLSEEVLE